MLRAEWTQHGHASPNMSRAASWYANSTLRKDYKDRALAKLEEYFRMVKCNVTPPNNLKFRVLPERRDGNLQFNLLSKKAITWSTPELTKALEKGYRIEKGDLVWIDNGSSIPLSDRCMAPWIREPAFLDSKMRGSDPLPSVRIGCFGSNGIRSRVAANAGEW